MDASETLRRDRIGRSPRRSNRVAWVMSAAKGVNPLAFLGNATLRQMHGESLARIGLVDPRLSSAPSFLVQRRCCNVLDLRDSRQSRAKCPLPQRREGIMCALSIRSVPKTITTFESHKCV